MKKMAGIMISAALVLSLTACGNRQGKGARK